MRTRPRAGSRSQSHRYTLARALEIAPVNTSAIAAIALAGAVLATTANAQAAGASSMRGRVLFLRCASCHEISDRASMKTGPNLKGVVGRKVGSLAGYAYSPAMKAQTFAWTPTMLDRWLAKPESVVPGTMMAFEGMPNPADRAALIAYLAKPTP